MKLNQHQKRPKPRLAPEGELRLEDFLPYRLAVTSARVSNALSRRYGERFGIGIPEWRVLANLGQKPDLTANEVVERSAMDKVTVSRAVAALLRKGLIVRRRDSDDRRKSRLRLSGRGVAVYAEIVPLALGFERELLARLTTEERASLASLLNRLAAA